MLICAENLYAPLADMLSRYGLGIAQCATNHPIPGSYWGEPEAGLIGNTLFIRPDTPLHSALHEASHYICMDDQRRQTLHTDAQGDDAEENAVCYLQILLAGQLPGVGTSRIQQDMDAWGYSFRLGSSKTWFEQDAEDARAWLFVRQIIDNAARLTWRKCQPELLVPQVEFS